MKKILLCCAAGMSTSLLVTKMRSAAKEIGVETTIEAVAVDKFRDYVKEYDVFLLGPQVRFKKGDLEKIAKEYNKNLDVINMMDYGTMNGKKVLEHALTLIKKEV